MSTLVFFPWLEVDQSLRFDSFELVPFQRGSKPAGGDPLQDMIDAVLEPYVDRAGESITSATLLRVGSSGLADNLTQEEINNVFVFSELLAAAGLSKREYFGRSQFLYCNRDTYRVIVHSFNEPKGAILRETRRRDGVAENYLKQEKFRMYRPEHIPSSSRVNIDGILLNSLLESKRVMSQEKWKAIFEAITSFNAANTDDPYTMPQAELVALNGAFERLFGLDGGNEKDLVKAFNECLKPDGDLTNDGCPKFLALANRERFGNSSTIREWWIKDLFRVRNDLAHGKIDAAYDSIWTILDHLLLASFVFPLALKRHLEACGFYEMQNDDFVFEAAFERLVCEDLSRGKTDGDQWPWDRVISEVRMKRTVGEVRKKHTLRDD